MKTRFICGLIVVSGLLFLESCSKKDDAKPPLPIVGTWTLDSYYLQDITANFNSWEGNYKGSFFGEQSNSLIVNNDKTYNWRIAYDGPDFNDTGKWTLTDTQLSLKSTTNPEEDFKVEQAITANQMIISEIRSLTLLPNAVVDTISQATWNNSALINSIYTKYGQQVDVTVVSLYEK